MMRRVPVMEAGRSTVTTGGGDVCGVIGAGRVVAGDVAWQMGDMIFSPGKKGSRPVFVWKGGGYRLATYDLKMMTVDKDSMEIVSEEAIERPVENAQLLAHTYNERAEYLVWFVDSRCIIQKDGETVADFASAFYAAPDEIDAYVDDNDDLIWGAAGDAAGEIIAMAVFKNAAMVKVNYFSREVFEEPFAAECTNRAGLVFYTMSATPYLPKTSSYAIWSPIPRNMMVAKVEYGGPGISMTQPPKGTGYARTVVYDLFNASAFINISGSGGAFITQLLHETSIGAGFIAGWDLPDTGDGFTLSDETWESGGLYTQFFRVAVVDFSNVGVIAERQVPDSGFTETVLTNMFYGMTAIEEYSEIASQELALVLDYPGFSNTATEVVVTFDAVTDHTLALDIMSHYYFDVIGRDREDNYVTRRALVKGYVGSFRIVDGNKIGVMACRLQFDSPWPEVPVSGDMFYVPLYQGVRMQETQDCTLHVTARYSPIEYHSGGAVVVDLGNDYSERNTVKIENEYGWVRPIGELWFKDGKISEASYGNTYTGAWSTEDGKAVGVAGYEIIKAEGSNVELIEPQYNPNVATRRFV